MLLATSTLHPRARGRETSTHFASASASHRGAAASLLDQSVLHGGLLEQSELHDGFRGEVRAPAGIRCEGVLLLVLATSTLHPSARGRDTSTHLESGSASHRGAAASLLDQSELHAWLPLRRQSTYRCIVPWCWWLARSVGAAWRLSLQRQSTCRCIVPWSYPGSGSSTLHPRARGRGTSTHLESLSRPPPRTVEQPQACSISRSCIVASVAKDKALAGA